jgi:LPS-assembly protein
MHAFAGINRSLSDSSNNKKTIGVAYESCCWAIRVAQLKEITVTLCNFAQLCVVF